MTANNQGSYWPRAIILVDMNAFFASIEQLDYPSLRGKPIAVTNGDQGSCVITSSYEARAFGVKTGMRLRDARKLCPHIIQRSSRPKRYTEISTCIMDALLAITPDREVYSIDEAFLDVTYCQKLHGHPITIGKMVQQIVWRISHLPCSIGISGDKTTAKYAAKQKKPNGLTVIPPWEAKQRLHAVPVTDLCGIADGISGFLAKYQVYTCGDMQNLPISILAKRFGNLGRRIWYMCQGADPEPVHTKISEPKSMGHGKVVPPRTKDFITISAYFMHMSEKLAARLRRYAFTAYYFFIGMRIYDRSWIGEKLKLEFPTDDGRTIYRLCQIILKKYWRAGTEVIQVQVTALNPHPTELQMDLFATSNLARRKVNQIVDHINQRFGEFKIAPAKLLMRSTMPNVIAPAWKPSGHRQTIE